MNFTKPEAWTKEQKIIAGGFALALISLILPWAKVSFLGITQSATGIQSFETILPVLILIYPFLLAVSDVKNIHKFVGVGLAAASLLYTVLKLNDVLQATSNQIFANLVKVRPGLGLFAYFVGAIAVGVGHFLIIKGQEDKKNNSVIV